ncbi:MAG: putative intracellular septation protein A [Gammaproteobacteria bacterium]|nr:MAG: putative intracellular septation protein A [Gammaproteobacteria bacterium]
MKLLYDFLPILLFFLAYKVWDLYAATAVAIGVALVQNLVYWLRHRRFDNMQLVALVLLVVLGGATLLLRDNTFIMWKPTAVNLLFAAVFAATGLFGDKPLVQRLLEGQLQLEAALWRRLNWSWVGFFLFCAAANLFVAYRYSEAVWVNFKLFGLLGLTLLFLFAQGLWLARHLDDGQRRSD